eukprot:TRINITY_DN202_c0_g1_i1.p1 TRINITY_DN202_c0_g1~~TRINITY_DN202_c0_g1_i1.p1  ORF type:complete len:196 (-),score=6.82 TRINITY_DN202_c0_g1_i1:68-655(-)
MTRTLIVIAFFALVAIASATCPNGENEVNCLVDPCMSNPCHEGLICQANYCGGCFFDCLCTSDEQCKSFEFCRGDGQCAKLSVEGEQCGGHVIASAQTQCSSELVCAATIPGVVDLPGVCAKPCTTSADCPSEYYCSATNKDQPICRSFGSCLTTDDCDNAENFWMRIECLGSTTCINNKCGVKCGANPPLVSSA